MTYQEAIQQFEPLSLAERIQIIEFLSRSVREELATIGQHNSVQTTHKPFHVRTFSLGGDVQFERDELYLERGF